MRCSKCNHQCTKRVVAVVDNAKVYIGQPVPGGTVRRTVPIGSHFTCYGCVDNGYNVSADLWVAKDEFKMEHA